MRPTIFTGTRVRVRHWWDATAPGRRFIMLLVGAAALIAGPFLLNVVVVGWLVGAIAAGVVVAFGSEANVHQRLARFHPAPTHDHSQQRTGPVADGGPTIVGVPGEYAADLARSPALRRAPWSPGPLLLMLAGAIVVVGTWLGDGRRSQFAASPFVLLCFGAGLVLGRVEIEHILTGRLTLEQDTRRKRARAAAGAKAERQVGDRLARCVGLRFVAHGQYLGAGGDADHIILGPCAAVVETKSGGGRLEVRPDGTVVAGNKVIRGDPVEQARRQAATLAGLLGVEVAAILCVPRASGAPRPAGDVMICNTSQLPAVLGRLPVVLDDAASAAALEKVVNRNVGERRRRNPDQPRRRPRRRSGRSRTSSPAASPAVEAPDQIPEPAVSDDTDE